MAESGILVIADVHLGGEKTPGLEWAVRTFDTAHDQGIKHLVVLGDVIDKDADESQSFPQVQKLFEEASKRFETTMFIAGNNDVDHDMGELRGPGLTIAAPEPHVIKVDGWALHTAAVNEDGDERSIIGSFPRPMPDYVNVGLLHTSVTGEYSKKACLPCTLDELLACDYDAWILGHVHERHVLNESPFVGWVGQGRALRLDVVDGQVAVRDL